MHFDLRTLGLLLVASGAIRALPATEAFRVSLPSGPAASVVVVDDARAAVSAGFDHACGLDGGGRAFCWGANHNGQIGDGTDSVRSVPAPVAGGLSFAALAAGQQRTCGVTRGGETYCWGDNTWGAIGDGSRMKRTEPT